MIFDRLVRLFEDAVCVISLSAIVVLILTQVFYRYLLSSGILWIDELVTNLMVVMVLIGAARATRVGAHTDLHMLLDAAPAPLSKALRVSGVVVVYSFLLVLIYFSARYAWDSRRMTTTMIRIPLWVTYGTIPLGGLLIMYELTKGLLLGFPEHEPSEETIT
jgi:TRAP-type C4-dicarboxylate transport system permease small subunit